MVIPWLFSVVSALSLEAHVVYRNDFEKAELGKVPDDFLVLDGGFSVKSEGTNKFLELPGAPLDNFAIQFGPAQTSDVAVQARIRSRSQGRRYPVFGVGLNGVAGYKLQISPAKKQIELLKDQELKTSTDFECKSDQWMVLKLQSRKSGAETWRIEGKAWADGTPEPKDWMVSADEKEAPGSGRGSVFGSPFSGMPIQFDDLQVFVINQ